MNTALNNLKAIEDWIHHAPNPRDFSDNNNEFMRFSVELMNRCLYLMQTGVALTPSTDEVGKGVTKHKAIIVGHMVRVVKLYEGLLIHISNRQLELASIFNRLIFETAMRMRYMIRSNTKQKTIRSFILASYKPEKEILDDLNEKKSVRPLIPIEKRMVRKIKARLRHDGVTIKELMENRIWDIDGKHFRHLLKALGKEHKYSYGFGSGSHAIHGDWYDIDLYHLDKEGRYYFPKLKYTDPDPRISGALTWLCLEILEEYLAWRKSDPNNILLPIIKRLWELNRKMDLAHEATLGE